MQKRKDVPSHGSGSVRAARSSIENLTSTPFSMRVSGSAFKSQYDLSCDGSPGPASDLTSNVDFSDVALADFGASDFALACVSYRNRCK